jgi:integrase
MVFRQSMGRISKVELRKAKNIIDQFFIQTGEEITVDEMFERAYRDHWEKMKTQWSVEVKKIYQKDIKDALGDRHCSRLSPLEIRTWHRKFEDKPTTGNRALSVLSKMFSYGEEMELLPLGQNPCRVVSYFPEKKRRRFAKKEELIKIVEILRDDYEDQILPVSFTLLLLYTGSRPSVFLNAKWDHLEKIERDGKMYGELTLHGKSTSRTNEDEKIMIPPQGMQVLKKLDPKTRYSLSGKIFGCPIPHRYWNSIRSRVGCKDLWLRDLRRTFATIGLSSGESVDTIGELLNHKSHETTKIYAKLHDEKRIAAVSSIANQIENYLPTAPEFINP